MERVYYNFLCTSVHAMRKEKKYLGCAQQHQRSLFIGLGQYLGWPCYILRGAEGCAQKKRMPAYKLFLLQSY